MNSGVIRNRAALPAAVLAAVLALAVVPLLAGEGLGARCPQGTVDPAAARQRPGGTVTAADTVPPEAVPPGASASVDSDSVIEIHLPAGTVFPDKPGTYTFQAIFTTAPSLDAAGISRVVAQAFRSLFRRPPGTASGYLARGRYSIASGDTAGALRHLERALETASEADLPELRFTLASSLSIGGNAAEALRQVSFIVPRESDAWAGDFAILKAQLLLESADYVQALTWLDQWGPKLQGDGRLGPLYHFMRALGERGTQDLKAEKSELLTVAASRDANLVAAAASLLDDL
jgi:hypothetical protein